MKDTGYEKDVVLSNYRTLNTLLRQLVWQCLVIHASSRTATKWQSTFVHKQNQRGSHSTVRQIDFNVGEREVLSVTPAVCHELAFNSMRDQWILLIELSISRFLTTARACIHQ